MKKIFLTTIILCAGVVGAFAQEATESNVPLTKNGYKILPEKGDFAIGIDAAPFFEYFGNMFNGTQANGSPTFGDFTLSGQYFLEDNRSVRATLRLNFGSDIMKETVQDDFAASQPGYNGQNVVDVWKFKDNEIDLALGYVFHRGYRRLQGYYGGEVNFSFASNKQVYTWANPMTASNQAPTSGFGVNPADRPTSIKDGNVFAFGIGAFAGVEYFFAPKMSVGGEFNLSLNMFNRWQGETTTETFDTSEGVVKENTTRNLDGYTGRVYLETLPSAKLMLNFYF